jgi:adenylate kinase
VNVALLGAPGSGKGTQAQRIAKKFNVLHISTGDIFRDEITRKTPLGLEVKSHVDSGRLVPDDLVVRVVSGRLGTGETARGFVLDGFPRTVGQAEALDAFLTTVKRPLQKVLHLKLEPAEVIARLTNRRTCRSCGAIYNLVTQPPKAVGMCDADGSPLHQRDDDTRETVEKRLSVYNDLTEPLIAYYHGLNLLETVSATGPVEDVLAALGAILAGLPATA